MILHYLKIAWRNLLKYKMQSVISILGLAIGFTAFSFTLSWIRHERGYDSHNPDADRIYCITGKEGLTALPPYGLTDYVRKNFPEVEAACNAISGQFSFPGAHEQNERARFEKEARFSVLADTGFFSVFYPEIKISFPDPLPMGTAVFTRSLAEKWNITPGKIGQEIDSLGLIPIAIVEDKPLHSNVAFRYIYLSSYKRDNQNLWNHYGGLTYIRLHEGASIERIERELDSLEVMGGHGERIHSYKVYPLRKVRYQAPNNRANLKFEALKQFSAVSFLLIICALLNYIMLFANRVQSRRREFTLNKVNGASNKEILFLLMVEFLLMLIAAIFLGSVITELLFPQFSRFSLTAAPKGYFIVSIFWYSFIIILLSVLATLVLTYRFVSRSTLENIAPRTKTYARQKINFSTVAIFAQLSIGIMLIFCTVLVFRQYHLMDQRVGYNRNGLVAYYTNKENIPVSEMRKKVGAGNFIINSEGVIARDRYKKMPIEFVDDEQQVKSYNFHLRNMDSDALRFLGIPLLKGRELLPSENVAYLINEAGNRELENNAIGNRIWGIPIIGVVPDLQVGNSSMKVEPVLYRVARQDGVQMGESVIFRFDNDSTEKRVREWFDENLPHTFREGYFSPGYLYEDIDERFKEFTKSERNLLMLISIITVVAILIALFGIYSMITLSCNRRRKEIAIRKVNGAKAGEIFRLFFREYFVVTLLSCVVAFPVGVYIMQRWLEQYTRRVSMEWWLFAGIFVIVVLIVLASIFSRVSRAARENPAEVVKSE